MAQEKFVMERLTRKRSTTKREYPHIRISAPAYAHVLEMSDETGHSLCDVASQAINYAYSNLVYADIGGINLNVDDGAELWSFELVSSDFEALEEVQAILRRTELRPYELARLLTSLRAVRRTTPDDDSGE